jgi:hypothetical protein
MRKLRNHGANVVSAPGGGAAGTGSAVSRQPPMTVPAIAGNLRTAIALSCSICLTSHRWALLRRGSTLRAEHALPDRRIPTLGQAGGSSTQGGATALHGTQLPMRSSTVSQRVQYGKAYAPAAEQQVALTR